MRIGLIGDLAIGMDRAGSHAWARQSDLLLGLSRRRAARHASIRAARTGASPASRRRRWSPRGFEPFLATLRAALRHAGGVRIDHIMGLMRLWLVPHGSPASEGAYLAYPLEDLLRLLALESHRHGAVVIGEDLGTVPPGFRARLRRAGIAGMDVLWFERDAAQLQEADALAPRCRRHDHHARSADGRRLVERRGHPDARARSASAPHGEEEAAAAGDRDAAVAGLHRAGRRHGAPPPADAAGAAVDAALGYVAQSPSPLMLAPLEDLLGLAEQPNLPGTIDEHPNWRRRLEPPADELLDAPQRSGAAPGSSPRSRHDSARHHAAAVPQAASPSPMPRRWCPISRALGISHLYASPIADGAAGLAARLRRDRSDPRQSRAGRRGGVARAGRRRSPRQASA